VFATLRREIVTAAIVPGTQISEQSLCERYGVSRTPVREAMLRLAGEGLVNIYPQVGTFVTRIDLEKVREAHFIREALECATARTAAGQATKAHVDQLQDLLQRQRSAAQSHDHESF